MFAFLPQEVQGGLAARPSAVRGQQIRHPVMVPGRSIAVLRLARRGLVARASDAVLLRGHVDMFEGARHLGRCLIVATAQNDDETRFEFKRNTPATDCAPRDFAHDDTLMPALPGRLT